MAHLEDGESELIFWPSSGRFWAKFGSLPLAFKDDGVEQLFREQNAVSLRHTLVIVGRLALVFQSLGASVETASIMAVGPNLVSIMNLVTILPMLAMAAVLIWVRVPDYAVKFVFFISGVFLLLQSKTRFAFFFAGTDVAIAFEEPDFPALSDSVIVLNMSLGILTYFLILPVRAQLSLVILPSMPAVYLALSLPVDGLETTSRILHLAVRLVMMCMLGLVGRIHLETRERYLFSRLTATNKELIKEKVLRFEAEHIAEQVSPQADLERTPDVQSNAAVSMTPTNLSSMIFTPHQDANLDVRAQLRAMHDIAEMEHWLLQPADLQFNGDSVLGHGGFGVVLRGKYAAGDVALKLPKHGMLCSSQDVARVVGRELRALRILRHPCIVSFYGAVIDIDSQRIILVEELISGTSMKIYISRGKQDIGENIRWHLLLQLVAVLEYLHREETGVIHGDLKPSNVMVTTSQAVKVIDFGMSLRTKTETKHNGGSLRYMAPELFRGAGATVHSDIFAFGRLAYFAATGKEPLLEWEREGLIKLASTNDVPSLHWPGESTLFTCCKTLCDACLQPEPDSRPSAAEALQLVNSWPFQVIDKVAL
eukprot:TRINITY_DN27957_c0_g1_i1.p1 TRINITY_DN27957_c0_g1~~TRINITY_DN27957_c0_g1_i1.p1  ORF type:complete len:595 (-),score=82.23 TRINITY_DN27957_c0_g1_i1:63-1847(-)